MLEHPFAPDLSTLTVDELSEKITSLRHKLNYAYRANNEYLINQINLLMTSYQNVYYSKLDQKSNMIKID